MLRTKPEPEIAGFAGVRVMAPVVAFEDPFDSVTDRFTLYGKTLLPNRVHENPMTPEPSSLSRR